MTWSKEEIKKWEYKRQRTKEILESLRFRKVPCQVIQVDFDKKQVVGVHNDNPETNNEQDTKAI